MNTMTPTNKKRIKGNGISLPTIFNDFFNDPLFDVPFAAIPSAFLTGARTQMPSANIQEKDDQFILELSAPGLKREDFKIDLEDGVLTISSEKEEEKKDEDKNYKSREFSYSSFSRSFSLPDNTAEDKINAKYTDGILHVTIPKKEARIKKPKKEIKVS
jgi:HSP20 family protein